VFSEIFMSFCVKCEGCERVIDLLKETAKIYHHILISSSLKDCSAPEGEQQRYIEARGFLDPVSR